MEEQNGWAAVAEGIVRGLTHDMNNRLLALMGVRELAEDGLDAGLLALFDDELRRLEAAVGVLRRLGAEPGRSRDLVESGPLLDGVRRLHGWNAAVRGVGTEWTVGERLPAVQTAAVAAERGLLQALAGSGAAAREAARRVEVTARADGAALVVDISPAPPEGGWRPALEAAGARCEADADALRVRFTPG